MRANFAGKGRGALRGLLQRPRAAAGAKLKAGAGLPTLLELLLPGRSATTVGKSLLPPILLSQLPRMLAKMMPITQLINRILLFGTLKRIMRMLDPLRAITANLRAIIPAGPGGEPDPAPLLAALGLLTPASK